MYADRVAAAAARRQDQEGAGRLASAAVPSDPYQSGWLGRLHASAGSFRVESGQVVDAVPGGAAYLVDAGQASAVWCSPGGTAAGFGAWGVRPLHSFPIGSFVIFVRHPQTPTLGTILAAEPPWVTHTAFHPADGVWPFTRSGQRVESAHQFPVKASADIAARAGIGGGVDVPDLSAGRPIDLTGVGEWGAMAETGVGVFADPFQAYLRVDEATGVFAFYPDQLLRVAGHNYQHHTSHLEHEELEDAGELVGFSRRCIYPWEAYGVSWPNQVTPGWQNPATPNHGYPPGQGTRFTDPFVSQDGSGDAVREPEVRSQTPAARILEWFGYLGQGGKRTVAAPAQRTAILDPGDAAAAKAAVLTLRGGVSDDPNPAPAGRIEVQGVGEGPQTLSYVIPPSSLENVVNQPGLIDITQSAAGSYRLRAVREIILAKRPIVTVPRQIRRPEDPNGDTAVTYRPSGWAAFGGTTPHKVAAGLAAAGGSPQRACMLPEVLTYLFNWEGLAPFAYHANDWAVIQEGDTGIVNQRAPNYLALETNQYLAAPTPSSVDIDHRYGLVDVYENESMVALLEDGTVVIGDGWGSEIRMVGGNIELHCAGDVVAYPGRDLISWAGHDVVLRAHDSLDLTTANGDIRTKAQRNHHAVAGNGGCGGFVHESKAVCAAHQYAAKVGEQVTSSGFTVIVPYSQFAVLAGDVAVVLDDTSADGRIFLDAGNSRHIHTRSRTYVSRITGNGAIVHLFDGSGPYPTPAANEFAAGYTLLSKDLLLADDLYVADQIIASGTIASKKRIDAMSTTDFGTVPADVTARAAYLAGAYTTAFKGEAVLAPHAREVEFTCRTTAQYLSSGYDFWQPRWRSIANYAGQTPAMAAWNEPTVVGLRSATPTLPHPGDRWVSGYGYRYYVFTMVDGAAGWVGIDRDDPTNRATYELPYSAAGGNTVLAGNYAVTVPPRTGL